MADCGSTTETGMVGMPKRMLRDWTDSEAVNSLSAHAERLFVRLVMKADDYGLLTADVRLLRAQLFPLLLESVREADMQRWIAECEKAGLIVLYEAGNKRCMVIRNFGQRIRDDVKPRHPLPPDYENLQSGDPPRPAENRRDPPPYSKTETKAKAKAETGGGVALPASLNVDPFPAKWAEWLAYRRGKGKPVSDTAAKKQLGLCERWGVDAACESIDQSIANDWQGLFEPKRRHATKARPDPEEPGSDYELTPEHAKVLEEISRD